MKSLPYNHPVTQKILKDKPKQPIYYKGSCSALSDKFIQIGVIGSRDISTYTFDILPGIFRFLSLFKCNIVSGGALGVDAFAHTLALQFQIPTCSFLASPVTDPSPKQNQHIFEDIQSKGCLLSTTQPYSKLKKYQFLERNKLLVNLCDILIVPQSQAGSGTMSTAEYALSENKYVFVPPVRAHDQSYDGNLILLKKGAQILSRAEDLLKYSPILEQHNKLLAPHLNQHKKYIRGHTKMQSVEILEAIYKKIDKGQLNHLASEL